MVKGWAFMEHLSKMILPLLQSAVCVSNDTGTCMVFSQRVSGKGLTCVVKGVTCMVKGVTCMVKGLTCIVKARTTLRPLCSLSALLPGISFSAADVPVMGYSPIHNHQHQGILNHSYALQKRKESGSQSHNQSSSLWMLRAARGFIYIHSVWMQESSLWPRTLVAVQGSTSVPILVHKKPGGTKTNTMDSET